MIEQKVQVKVMDADIKGVYSNLAQITHTKEEFWIDFFGIFPPMGALVARVIMSPGHAKRLMAALNANIKKYEEQFGGVEPAEEPRAEIGFSTGK